MIFHMQSNRKNIWIKNLVKIMSRKKDSLAHENSMNHTINLQHEFKRVRCVSCECNRPSSFSFYVSVCCVIFVHLLLYPYKIYIRNVRVTPFTQVRIQTTYVFIYTHIYKVIMFFFLCSLKEYTRSPKFSIALIQRNKKSSSQFTCSFIVSV